MTAARLTTDLKTAETQAYCHECVQAVSITGRQKNEIFAALDAASRLSKEALAGP